MEHFPLNKDQLLKRAGELESTANSAAVSETSRIKLLQSATSIYEVVEELIEKRKIKIQEERESIENTPSQED